MNTYSTSWGERFSTDQINRKSDRAAKRKLEEQRLTHGYNFCEECRKNSCRPIDVAHIVSRKEAKESGRAELCWDLNNLRVLGRSCHQKYDNLNLQFG